MKYSMIMGQQESDLISSLKTNSYEKEPDIIMTETLIKASKKSAQILIRTNVDKTKEFLFVEWISSLNNVWKIPIYFQNSFSQFYYLFSALWSQILIEEKRVKGQCKKRKIDYKTFRI